jgi:hypothetical protein
VEGLSPHPRPSPLQLGRRSHTTPAPHDPRNLRGREALGVRSRPQACYPSCVTCDPGAGPSPASRPTSVAAAATLAPPAGPGRVPLPRPVCK